MYEEMTPLGKTTIREPQVCGYGNTDPPKPSEKQRRRAWDDRWTRRTLREYRRTNDPALRDKVFCAYLPLVKITVKQYLRKTADYEDLYQEGSLGLLSAIERFDFSRGCQFSTFASHYIKGGILQYYRDKTWPCSVPRQYKDLSLRIRRLTGELGRDPSRQEIVDCLGIPEDKIDAAIAASKVWEPIFISESNPTDSLVFHLASEDVLLDSNMDEVATRLTVEKVLGEALSPEEEEVIRLYYYDDLSQREIASQLGTYQMMVFRLLRSGMSKIEKQLEGDEPGPSRKLA